MVHALEEIHRLLNSGGLLIDIHPEPEGVIIKALQGDRVLFAERKRENCSADVISAEKALAEVVERDLFSVDQYAEFDFLTYASTVPELRAYWDEQNEYEDEPKDEAAIKREEDLYGQVEQIMQASRAEVAVAMYERVRITKLRPVRN